MALLATCLFSTTAAGTELQLARVFSDHLVLQRELPIVIWGSAATEDEVRVSFAGQTATTHVDSRGQWRVQLAPLPASEEARDLVVSAIRKGRVAHQVHCRDVLVGEVWFAAGQSNLVRPVSDANRPAEETAAARFPSVRIFTAATAVAWEPCADLRGGDWRVSSPATAPNLPAVAFFFARELHQKLGVPVGIIQSSWGNTPVEAWMSREILASLPETQREFAAWRRAVQAAPDGAVRFEEHHREWARQYGKRAKGEPAPPRTFSKKAPSAAYNAMVAPLTLFRFRGVIWYQGESNAYGNPTPYGPIFRGLIQSWRRTWGVGDFPFLFVQLANHLQRQPQPVEEPWAVLREGQRSALREPNTAMVVAIDLGGDGIHPKNKQDVGARLALAARALAYGEPIEHSGPLYHSSAVENRVIRVRFTHARGLRAKGGAPLQGFALAGADRKFVWAEARFEDESVLVSSPLVPAPVAVRYAFANNPVCNLENAAGLPAAPFRTDEWALPSWPSPVWE